MKKALTSIVFGLCALAQAQTIDNIIDLSTPQLHGTARFTGAGGAFMALGNDLSALHYNPAAIGVYRRNQFGFSLGLDAHQTKATYGTEQTENGFELLFENIGLVRRFGSQSNTKSRFAFGITYTKKADFYQNLTAQNINTGGATLGEYWFQGARGFTPNELLNRRLFEEYAAFQTFVLDTVNGNTIDTRGFTTDGSTNQANEIIKYGRTNEFAITVGGSYSEILQWGVSVNIPTTNITTQNIYDEFGFDSGSLIRAHTIDREEFFTATGVNTNLGVIIKPTQWLRLAASYQTPSLYRFSSSYSILSFSTLNNGSQFEHEVLIDNDGRFTLPGVFRAGIATVIGKRGFFSVDYETTNAQNTFFRGTDFDSDEIEINASLQRINTLRSGLELRFNKYFLRGGYMFSSNPLNENNNFERFNRAYTGGFGIRNKYYSVDFSLVHSVLSRDVPTYPGDRARLDAITRKNNLIVTFTAML